jgi:hypothetical protein
MVNEAQKAGLLFDSEKMAGLNVTTQQLYDQNHPENTLRRRFQKSLDDSARSGYLHDCLSLKKGASRASVTGWQLLEYLVSQPPFENLWLHD